MLHPDNDFNVERTLLKDDVQKLIKVKAYDNDYSDYDDGCWYFNSILSKVK